VDDTPTEECRRSADVLIVSPDPFVRDGLSARLRARRLFRRVASVASTEQAAARVVRQPAALAVVDVTPASVAGVRVLRQTVPDLPVFAFSRVDAPHVLRECLRVHVCGFHFSLSDDITGLVRGVEAAAHSEFTLCPRSQRYVFEWGRGPRPEAPGAITLAERALLQRIAAGERTRQIAQALGISQATVKWRLAKLMHKLGVTTRAAAVAWGLQRDAVAQGPASPPRAVSPAPLPDARPHQRPSGG
jgi:DNA-binding NarL/FixJ family response regulator